MLNDSEGHGGGEASAAPTDAEGLFKRLKRNVKADYTSKGQVNWRREAREDFDFEAGEQSDENDKAILQDAKRPIVIFNRVGTTVDSVAGQEVANRQELQFLPRRISVAKKNELLTSADQVVSPAAVRRSRRFAGSTAGASPSPLMSRRSLMPNPPDKWIRSNFPTLGRSLKSSLFWQAKAATITRPRIIVSSEEMLNRLKHLLGQTGKLSAGIINEADGMPCADSYTSRFGSLREAYSLSIIDLPTASNISTLNELSIPFSPILRPISHGVFVARLTVHFDERTNVLTLNGQRRIWLLGARYFLVKSRWPRWTIARANKENADLVIVCRMNECNQAPLDYYLLPSIKITGPKMQLTEKSSVDLEQYRIVNRSELVDWVSGYIST